MSNISSNSLFHFAHKLSYLIEIFKRGFQPRYCMENIKLNNERSIRGVNFGIPMTCFCDISLGQISNHISTYGNYGIGMKKEWGIERRLNPIIYVNKESYVADSFSVIAGNALELNKHKEDNVRKLGSEIMNSWLSLMMYSKPYIGSFNHNGNEYENVKFYNEREWRYIPTKNGKAGPFGALNKEKMENLIELEQENEKLKDYRLNFRPDDVKYIFVKDEDEIHKMVAELRAIKSPIYDNKTIDILTSKILTTKQVFEDF